MKLASEKKLQRHMIRFLMIDSQQTAFNAISKALEEQHYTAQGKLLDDVASFEKALNLQWDAIIFNNAYDFDYKKALTLIEDKGKATPLILLSDLDPTYPDILEAYQLGTYVVCSAINYDYLTLCIYRASVHTRLVRRENQLSLEIDNLQQQTQTLVETTEHAVAIFQEGVHVSFNEQYAKLFGGKNTEEFVGLPILDILQPVDTQDFKQQFKRLSKGDFSQSNFIIQTQNPTPDDKNLPLQFSATEFEDESALQLVILNEVNNQGGSKSGHDTFVSAAHLQHPISTGLIDKPSVALFTFSLDSIPTGLLQHSWEYFSHYCKSIEANLINSAVKKIFRIAEHVFVAIIPLDNDAQLAQISSSILQHLPKTADVHGNIFSVELSVGNLILKDLNAADDLADLVRKAQQQKVASISSSPLLSLEPNTPEPDLIPAFKAEEPLVVPNNPGLSLGEVISEDPNTDKHNPFASKVTTTDGSHQSLLEQIEDNSLKLHFQQLYDKEDIDTHLYEVTGSFTHEGKIIDLESYDGLNTNAELAVKLDRWILVEASKRLHQFLNTCPKARIVINMHSASFNDSSLITLLTKLVSLINSKYTKPLILQFQEESILTDMDNATKFIQSVQEYGIGIAISGFGESSYSTTILSHVKPIYAKLAPQFGDFLQTDDGIVELQEKLDSFKEKHADLKFVLAPLNDMTTFANAWNVDARYLQGSYFQAKQQDFVDNAG